MAYSIIPFRLQRKGDREVLFTSNEAHEVNPPIDDYKRYGIAMGNRVDIPQILKGNCNFQRFYSAEETAASFRFPKGTDLQALINGKITMPFGSHLPLKGSIEIYDEFYHKKTKFEVRPYSLAETIAFFRGLDQRNDEFGQEVLKHFQHFPKKDDLH